MKRSISTTLRRTALLAAVVAGLTLAAAGRAGAISLTFEPVTLDMTVGGTAAVDVMVSGLEAGGQDEIVSAFDLFIGFDPAILSVGGVTFATYFDPDPLYTDFFLKGPGELEIYGLSQMSDADLQVAQGDAVTLATISFDGLSAGTSLLTFLDNPIFGFQDVKGTATYGPNGELLPLKFDNAAVPEPGTLLLLGSGLLGLVGTGLRRRRG